MTNKRIRVDLEEIRKAKWVELKGKMLRPECSAKNNKLLKAKTRDNTLKAKKRPEVKDEQVSTK